MSLPRRHFHALALALAAQAVPEVARPAVRRPAQLNATGSGPVRGQTPIRRYATRSKCSTTGGLAKYAPTIARHCGNSGPPRKSTVWFSSVSQWIVSR